jgi:DNA-binding response OmpR family regulator
MTERCPYCGGSVLSLDVLWNPATRTLVGRGRVVHFAPREAQIFDALWQNRRALQDRVQLAARAFADDIDGGPESFNTISVYLHKIEQKITPFGLRLVRPGIGRRGGYGISDMRTAAPEGGEARGA